LNQRPPGPEAGPRVPELRHNIAITRCSGHRCRDTGVRNNRESHETHGAASSTRRRRDRPNVRGAKTTEGRPDESPLLGRFVLATRSVPARVPLGADERAVAEGVRAQRVDERRRRIDGRVLDVVHCAPARRVQPGLVAHTLRALVVGARRVATEAEATDDVPAGTVSGTPPPNVMMPPATSPVPPPWPLGGAKKSGLKGFELFSPYEGMARLDERVQPSSGQR